MNLLDILIYLKGMMTLSLPASPKRKCLWEKRENQWQSIKRNLNKKIKHQKKLPVTVMLWWKQHISNHFSGANITDMKSYLLPTKSLNLENIVLHCSTNDLKKENSANEISNDIIEVALLWKSDNNNVLGSGIINISQRQT